MQNAKREIIKWDNYVTACYPCRKILTRRVNVNFRVRIRLFRKLQNTVFNNFLDEHHEMKHNIITIGLCVLFSTMQVLEMLNTSQATSHEICTLHNNCVGDEDVRQTGTSFLIAFHYTGNLITICFTTPANTRHIPIVGLLLGQRHRR